MAIRCMANLLDDDKFVIPGCVRRVTTWSLGCPAVQTSCVLALDLAGRLRDLTRFWRGRCNYWFADRAVVWCAVVAYGVNRSVGWGKNLWCSTVVTMMGCIPACIVACSARLPCALAVWGHACRDTGMG